MNPYPSHYRMAFAFCHFLCHLWYWFSSQNSYLIRTTNGLPSFVPRIIVGHLGGSYKTGSPYVHSLWHGIDCHNRASVPFWLMRYSACFRMFRITIPTDLHLSVLYMSFSLAAWNCQVQFYTSSSSELCTNPLSEMHIRLGTF